MSDRAHLELVTGELPADGPQTFGEALALAADLEKQLAGAERDIRAWRKRYGDLKADKEQEAHSHKLWAKAEMLFTEWRIATGRTRSRFSHDRFWLCEPYLRVDGFVVCRWAVWGVAYEPFTKTLPSGLVERYDDFELAFKTRGNFERYSRRGWANPEARKQFADREDEAP